MGRVLDLFCSIHRASKRTPVNDSRMGFASDDTIHRDLHRDLDVFLLMLCAVPQAVHPRDRYSDNHILGLPPQ